jgi:ribosomal protein L14E/L6E/L27E
LKPGRLVVVTAGRFSGRKAVLLRANEEPNKERKFGHALIVGVERQPKRVTRRMGVKKIQKRSQVKAFVKFVNLNHVMPTRYTAIQDSLGTDSTRPPSRRSATELLRSNSRPKTPETASDRT